MKGKRRASVPTSVFLTEELKRDILEARSYYGLSMSDIIRLAVREWLSSRPVKLAIPDTMKEELTDERT